MSIAADLFKKEAILLLEQFPDLKCETNEAGTPYIYGGLSLKDDNGNSIDRYFVRIEPGVDYPNKFPAVFETGNRIPPNKDWHVFEANGQCCIKSWPEEALICRRGIDLTSFVKEQALPYFFNQKHREVYGYFLHERSHGDLGHLEFFFDILGTRNLQLIETLLGQILIRREPKSNSRCICGSKRKFRKCHRRAFRKVALLTNDELRYYIKITQARQPQIAA